MGVFKVGIEEEENPPSFLLYLLRFNLNIFRWEFRMGKQPKSSGKKKGNKFQKIYREFTRVKFNKYKLQFPRLRESEIVTKILR